MLKLPPIQGFFFSCLCLMQPIQLHVDPTSFPLLHYIYLHQENLVTSTSLIISSGWPQSSWHALQTIAPLKCTRAG